MVAAALQALHGRSWTTKPDARALPQVQAILQGSEALRRECILSVSDRVDSYSSVQLLSVIARKRVELSAEHIERLLTPRLVQLEMPESLWSSECLRLMSRQIEHAYAALPGAEKERLKPLLGRAAEEVEGAATATRLRKLVGPSDGIRVDLIDEGDDIGPRLRAAFETADESIGARATALDLLAAFPTSGRPSKKWLAEVARIRGLLSWPAALVSALLDAALDAAETNTEHTYSNRVYTATRYATAGNESFLCGVVTIAGHLGDPALLPQLQRLAVKSVTVIGGQFGSPRSLRLANASAQAMAEIGAPSSITELLALERSVRHGTLLKQVRKAIDALASAQGMTREQLLERAVETHDLDNDGERRVSLSRGSALIVVDGRTASLVYVDENQTPRKSVPADVKQADVETLAAIRGDLKAIRKTIAGERLRLDSLMALDRRWPLDDWRTWYLDHPITGCLTRTLVWAFSTQQGQSVVGIPRDTATAVTSSGQQVAIPADAEVRLWHPIHATADEVRAWRRYLLEQQIVQPLKQAFRELYVLTPAEERSRVYSNRFAGHIFGQVQARALMKGRGWTPVAVAWWDDGIDHGVARRTYDTVGIRAEFFFDPILDHQPTTSDLYPYCTSDQVRFVDIQGDDSIELADVPPLVLTEAMRDVDLFVGVTSIGADPEWLDRGAERRFETYWHTYSFGELSAAGEIRRDVLEQLVPRLAIADRCELEDRYLRVRGNLRTYRIHLGSGNILMSPNDQYLCIVTARDSQANKLFLPFDDDPVLSLVLSKAFLLANDTAIKDTTITAQINHH
ncbi:uncharacterized protein DUF4132 [Kribbella orskensis]|uniref:Uncharacterized protein DUF4132 n=2 Tax=Kribbella orskensis TaxID=2512216 RepID=A0ABY2BWC2_9ACTN|nr:DUF4132 domain-containing protein [Kribbella sp. VKM Ac-2500]TCN44368.1 uncharacterized protein DUF4132 [Kribbella sp. VKM Ac-2500]TCO31854.1 uncharacterized protein DUF4132 [Kribbella orskensis]